MGSNSARVSEVEPIAHCYNIKVVPGLAMTLSTRLSRWPMIDHSLHLVPAKAGIKQFRGVRASFPPTRHRILTSTTGIRSTFPTATVQVTRDIEKSRFAIRICLFGSEELLTLGQCSTTFRTTTHSWNRRKLLWLAWALEGWPLLTGLTKLEKYFQTPQEYLPSQILECSSTYSMQLWRTTDSGNGSRIWCG